MTKFDAMFLFNQHQNLIEQLNKVEHELKIANRNYSQSQGYCMPLRMEAFRNEVYGAAN